MVTVNRISAVLLSGVALALKAPGAPAADSLHPVTDAHDGWRLSVQAWTFNAMDLDRWTEAHRNPDGTPNKFNTADSKMPGWETSGCSITDILSGTAT